MLTPQEVRELALSLDGTQERDHFGQPSFRVERIFATLWPEQNWVHLMLTPEMQHELVAEAPDIFAQVPNKWGENGATRAGLEHISRDEMLAVLTLAHGLAAPKAKSKRRVKASDA